MSEEIVSIFFIPITREANVETPKQIFKLKKKKKLYYQNYWKKEANEKKHKQMPNSKISVCQI